ncbi:MAG: hypothetical protein ABIG84_07265 [archaeon]
MHIKKINGKNTPYTLNHPADKKIITKTQKNPKMGRTPHKISKTNIPKTDK